MPLKKKALERQGARLAGMASFVVVVPLHRGASLGNIANKCDRLHIFENSEAPFSTERQRASGRRQAAAERQTAARWQMLWGILLNLVAGGHAAMPARARRPRSRAGQEEKEKRDCHHDILLWHDFHL